MHYDIEDNDLQRMSKESSGTRVEQLQPNMERNSYKSASKQLQPLMKNDMCVKKKTRNDEKFEVMNNTNKPA